MKKLFFILLLIPFLGFSQIDYEQYKPVVAWSTNTENVIFLNTDTFTVDVSPLDLSEPGAFPRYYGNYFIDNRGHRFEIIDSSSAPTLTVVDIFKEGLSPYQGKIGYCYKSAGDGNSPSIPTIMYEKLDEKAFDYGYRLDMGIIWEEKAEYPIPADSISLDTITNPTDYSVQDWNNWVQSAGIVSGCDITDGGSGTVDVSAGYGFIKDTDSDIGDNKIFAIEAQSGITLTDEATNFIYVDYNSGSPVFAVSLTQGRNGHTQFNLGKVFREGTGVDIINSGLNLYDFNRRVQQHHVEEANLHFVSGAVVSEVGTRNISITAGVMYAGLNRTVTDAINTSTGDDFEYYYNDATGWIESDETQIDNIYYNDFGVGLAELTSNRYTVAWVYKGDQDRSYVVYGQGNYKEVQAIEARRPSSLPDHVENFGVIRAKIIIKKSATTFFSIEQIGDGEYTSTSVNDHNELTSLQGGIADEYYHLTSDELTAVQDSMVKLSPAATQTGDIDISGNAYFGDNVGIGTTNPGRKLDIKGVNLSIRFLSNTTTGSTIDFIDQAWQSQITGEAGKLLFKTGGTTEKARITTTGDLLVGTTTATHKLTVNGDIGATSLNLSAPSSATSTSVVGLTAGGDITTDETYLDSKINTEGGWTKTGTNVHLTTSTDNVGIGKTNPDSKLDVLGNLGIRAGNGLRLYNSADNGWATINFNGSVNSNYPFSVTAGTSVGALQKVTQTATGYAATFMGGEVGIGTETPTHILTVNGGIGATSLNLSAPSSATSTSVVGLTAGGDITTDETYLDSKINTEGGWTKTGTNVHLTTSTDSVGIGTDEPLNKLHIENGEIIVESNTGDAGGAVYLGNSGHGIFRGSSTATEAETSGNDVFVKTTLGSVHTQIGSDNILTTDADGIDINGTGLFSGNLGFGANFISYSGSALPAWTGGFEINNEAGVGPHIRGFTIRFDVGVSTGSPLHPTYENALLINSDGNVLFSEDVTADSYIKDGATTTNLLLAGGGDKAESALLITASQVTDFVTEVANNAITALTGEITGAGTGSVATTITNGVVDEANLKYINAPTDGDVTTYKASILGYEHKSAAELGIIPHELTEGYIGYMNATEDTIKQSDIFYDEDTGYTGIGTDEPAGLLHVSGIYDGTHEPLIKVTNAGGIGGATFEMVDVVSNSDWKIKAKQDGSFSIRNQYKGQDVLVFDSTALSNTIYASGIEVGIGTDIHLHKDQDASTALTIQNSSTGTAAKSQIILGNDGGASPYADLFINTFGANFTESGLRKPSSSVIVASLGLTNGLSIGTTAEAPLRLFTNGQGNTETVIIQNSKMTVYDTIDVTGAYLLNGTELTATVPLMTSSVRGGAKINGRGLAIEAATENISLDVSTLNALGSISSADVIGVYDVTASGQYKATVLQIHARQGFETPVYTSTQVTLGLDLGTATTVIGSSTTSLAGLMSAADKTKLDGVTGGLWVTDANGINSDGENVAINANSTPAYELYVNGDAGITGQLQSDEVHIGATSVTPVDLHVHGETNLNGNVGIGIFPTTYKLNVSGDINISSSSAYYVGGTAGISTTFVDNDGNTITVTKGIITAKTAP